MKIHLHDQGVYMVGKAWEIRKKLQEYSQCYETVAEWVADERISRKKTSVIPFPIRKRKLSI
jgi:hypothetical protein